MQFEIRFPDDNYIVIDTSLQKSDDSQPGLGPEVLAAVVTKHQLPDITINQALDVVGQAIEALAEKSASKVPAGNDWRADFRAGE